VENLRPNKTNNNKTKFNNTDFNQSINQVSANLQGKSARNEIDRIDEQNFGGVLE